MSFWTDAGTAPIVPDIYRVRLPYYPYIAFARWDGAKWCVWGNTKERAAMSTFSGPKAGYDWRLP